MYKLPYKKIAYIAVGVAIGITATLGLSRKDNPDYTYTLRQGPDYITLLSINGTPWGGAASSKATIWGGNPLPLTLDLGMSLLSIDNEVITQNISPTESISELELRVTR